MRQAFPQRQQPSSAPTPSRRGRTLAAGALLALLRRLVPAGPAAAADVTGGLLLRYDLTQTSGTTLIDSSGNGNNATLNGGGTWTGANGLALDGG